MGMVSFEGYCLRTADFTYRAKHRDIPHDVTELLELARDIELTDKIAVDVADYRE